MASSFTQRLRLELQADGENDDTWGLIANRVFELIDDAISGVAAIDLASGSVTLSTNSGTADEARQAALNLTGALTANRNVIVPDDTKIYLVRNGTSGAFTATVKTSGGTGIAVPQGYSQFLFVDGTNVIAATPPISDAGLTSAIRLAEQGSAPAAETNVGQVYSKDVSGKTELFYKDSAGNETPITKAGSLAAFETGTSMIFAQSTAPLGWTKSTTHNDKALRVVSGAASSGGTVDFTTAFASKAVSVSIGGTAITEAQMPQHRHQVFVAQQSTGTEPDIDATHAAAWARGNQYGMKTTGDGIPTIGPTSYVGSGSTHTHTATGTAINLAVKYVDVIIATKD